MGPDKFKDFREFRQPEGKTNEFEYSDSAEKNIHKEGEFPDLGNQENPEK